MWLKKAADRINIEGIVPKETFSDEDAIAIFGVGRNMVASIKHWALACDVLREDSTKKHFVLDETAREIYR